MTLIAAFQKELAGFEATSVFARLSAMPKHAKTQEKDVKIFGMRFGDRSRLICLARA